MLIGTTLYQGTLRTYNDSKTATQPISAPDPSSYNYDLGQADLPLYLLDLRKIPPGPVTGWAQRPATTLLMYGLGGEDLSTLCLIDQWFDVILHVQQTTPSHPL